MGREPERDYSHRTRIQKLGIKPGMVVSVTGLPDDGIRAELRQAGAIVSWGRLRAGSDLVLFGVHRDADLAGLGRVLAVIRQSGGIWVLHPRGKEGVRDTTIFSAGGALGLVSNKVMRFSESLSGDRLVIPVSRRTAGGRSGPIR